MTPAAPMQGKPVRLPVIAVGAVGAALAMRAVLALAVLRRMLMLRLAAGDE